jgi:hypothetical protein
MPMRWAPSSWSTAAVTIKPLKVQKPATCAWPAWWKPEHGATATPPERQACLAAERIAPLVWQSEAATAAERLPKPLGNFRSSTPRTNRSS